MNARGYISTNTCNARSDLGSVTDALAGVLNDVEHTLVQTNLRIDFFETLFVSP